MDSHADTIVAGRNCVVLNYVGKECDVHAFSDSHDAIKNVPLAQVGTAWQSPESSQTYILVMNEALWMGDQMIDTLINPNQLRHFGINVQDNPTSSSPLSIITEDANFAMPLQRKGTIVFCNTRPSTQHELETCPHIQLSSSKSWDPTKVHFSAGSHSLEEEVERIRRVSSTHKKTHDNIITDWANKDRAHYSNNVFDLSSLRRKISSMRIHKVPTARTMGTPSDERKISSANKDIETPKCVDTSKLEDELVREHINISTSTDVKE